MISLMMSGSLIEDELYSKLYHMSSCNSTSYIGFQLQAKSLFAMSDALTQDSIILQVTHSSISAIIKFIFMYD